MAQYLVQEILNYSKDDSQPEVQGSKEIEISTTTKRSSKRRKQSDRSYQLPKSSRTQPDIPRDGAEDSHEASSVSSQLRDELVTCPSGHDQSSDSLVTDQPLLKCEGDIPKIITEEVPQEEVVPQEGVQGHSRTLPSIGSESALAQLKATCSSDKRDAVHKQPSATLDKAIEDTQFLLERGWVKLAWESK